MIWLILHATNRFIILSLKIQFQSSELEEICFILHQNPAYQLFPPPNKFLKAPICVSSLRKGSIAVLGSTDIL